MSKSNYTKIPRRRHFVVIVLVICSMTPPYTVDALAAQHEISRPSDWFLSLPLNTWDRQRSKEVTRLCNRLSDWTQWLLSLPSPPRWVAGDAHRPIRCGAVLCIIRELPSGTITKIPHGVTNCLSAGDFVACVRWKDLLWRLRRPACCIFRTSKRHGGADRYYLYRCGRTIL